MNIVVYLYHPIQELEYYQKFVSIFPYLSPPGHLRGNIVLALMYVCLLRIILFVLACFVPYINEYAVFCHLSFPSQNYVSSIFPYYV